MIAAEGVFLILSMFHKPSLILALAGFIILMRPSAQAILIADGFTYGGTNGFEASRALATDYVNFPMFEGVGVVSISEDNADYTATGTLLNNQWVLTAAHDWTSGVNSIAFLIGGTTYAADMTSLRQHPLWSDSERPSPSQGWDIALFRLATPVTNTMIFPQLYTKSDEMGKVAIILGVGDIGTGSVPSSGQTNNPPLVHAAMNIVDRTTSQTNLGYSGGLLMVDFDSGTNAAQNTLGNSYHPGGDPWAWAGTNTITTLNPPGAIAGSDSSNNPLVLNGDILEGSMVFGDSGGSVFIEDEGIWKLAGVNSSGGNPWDALVNTNGSRGLYGNLGSHTRISQHTDWIESVIPEPGTGALLIMGLGLALILCSEARRRVMRKWNP